MWITVLLPVVTCFLVLPSVDAQSSWVPNPPEVTHTSHSGTTSGASGTQCTPIGRRCLTTALCEDRKCRCPNGTIGDGLIECIPPDHALCVLAADPHLRGFSEARANADLPCRFRLTRFLTNHTKASAAHSYCSVEVYATNMIHQSNYYVHGVHITVGVTDVGKQVHEHFELRKYGVNDDAIYQYTSNLTKVRSVWGFSQHEKIKGVDIYPIYDEDNNFAVLSVSMCDVRIKYRAYGRNNRRQNQLPGITIMAPPHAQFVAEYGAYPNSACGQPTDRASLYEDRARQLGLDTANLAVIYDILNENAPQIDNAMWSECEEATTAFSVSGDQVADMNACGPILTTRSTRMCAVSQGLEPLNLFNACMRYRKNGNQIDCGILKASRDGCKPRMWRATNDISC